MSHYTPRYRSGTMGPHARRGGQQNPQGRFPPAHPRIFHGEIQELSYALEMERAGRVEDNQKLAHLEAELEETKLQLKKQKALKETFINEAKEAKRELERLEKFSDPAVLNAAVIASKVHNDVKYMKKKNLQQDFEELKVAHLLSREAFVAEIQAERKTSLALQEELNQLQTSYEELRSQYEADDALLRQEAETQKYDEARLSEEQRLLENLRAEKDEMYQEMSQTITFLQGSEKLLQEELTQLKCSYNELNCKYERDVSGLKQDMDRYQEEVRQKDANIERDNENLQLINKLRAEKEELLQKMSGEIETYQHQVEQERKAHLEKTEEDKKLLDNMRAEKEELLHKMSGEISIWQKREKQMLHGLDQVHTLYDELKCRYERDIMDIQQQVETYEQKVKQEETALSKKEKKEKLIQERKHSALKQEVEKLQQQVETYEQKVKQEETALSKKEKKEKLIQERKLSALKQEVEKLQQQVEQGRKAHLEKTEEDKKLLDNMRAEKEELFLKMSGEIETYQQQVEQERKAHLEKTEEDKKLLDNMRAEKEELLHKMSGEISIRQKREKQMLHELDQVHTLYEELKCSYERDIMDIQQQVETYEQKVKQEETALSKKEKKEKLIQERKHSALKQEVEKLQQQVEQERKAHLEKTEEDKKLLDNMRAEKEELLHKMSGEISIRQKREKQMLHELDQVHTLYDELKCRYERDIMDIQQQVETYKQKIYKNDLQRARDDLLLADSLRAEEEGFQQQPITLSQEKKEDSQNQVKVLNQEVSSEEDLSGEPLPGSSTDPESSEETEVAGETILEDLDNPDGKRKKSKISFWKKVRNFLRSKKPKKKQTSKDNQDHV